MHFNEITNMKKLRIGVWINDNIKPESGGAFGYYNELYSAY